MTDHSQIAVVRDNSTRDEPAEMSVVLVTPDRFETIRRTTRHLRNQAVADRIELIIVAPTTDAINDADPTELDRFRRVICLAADGPIRCVEKASVPGVLAASAPIIALIEDHAFPAPGWAEAILQAHREPWAAVGSAISNGNPTSSLSWASLMLAYGRWVDPEQGGEVNALPGHNITYKRERLMEFGDRLPEMFGRESTLHDEIQASGHRLYLEPKAEIAHLNPSLIGSTIVLRAQAGWLYGALRARREGWSPWKRLVYIAGFPLIPLIRFRRVRSDLFNNAKRGELLAKIWPGLAFALVLDGVGQAIGYAIGPGRTRERLSAFEINRIRHLSRHDQAELASSDLATSVSRPSCEN